MKEFGLRLLGMGLIIVGLAIVIHALFGLGNLLNNRVEGYFRSIYIGFVIFEVGFGVAHGFLGHAVFRLKRMAVNVALVSCLVIVCLTIVFSRGIPDPWDKTMLPYLVFSLGFFYYYRNPIVR